ncbi:MAG: hypothetical protein KF773_12015 [Deltaproteobacteria bacterium]|nr:hypothetical protein [Deltaproteobacteria bacterium]MCW5803188.1 hypothetical protein [Deltaproteobacteria bacterium]
MRNFLTTSSGLLILAATAACGTEPAPAKEPPVLKITSPERALVKNGAGPVTVKGTVEPNAATQAPVEKVLVNGVQATVGADGTFQATVDIREGATLIKTVARDAEGGEAQDTRAVHAGDVRNAGSSIDNALTASLSKGAFAKLSAIAGPALKGLNLGQMIAPMQPMVKAGGGPDCLYAHVAIDDVRMSNVAISLTPTHGGLKFGAEITGLDVPGHANYAVACVDGASQLRVTANRIVIGGTLLVSPNGRSGFTTDLVDQRVTLEGFHLSASGIPGTIIDMISMDRAIESIVPFVAKLGMEPMLNQALGALAGPKQLDVMGKRLTVEVSPSDIFFDPSGALVGMNMAMLIGGAEKAKYIYTENGTPAMDASKGFAIGLADDLANQMIAQAHALGLLKLGMPAQGATFNGTEIEMALPPMISADPADGKLRVVLGDMIVTYTDNGTPIGKAALNATIDLAIEPAANGYAVAVKLGKPTVAVNVLDLNQTRMSDEDLEKATQFALEGQIANISKLLVNIPIPSVAGLQMRNLSVGSDSGYVMVKGSFE